MSPGRPATTCELVPAPPLGLQELDDCWYSSTWVALNKNDALLLYTDGITEAQNKEGTPYPFPTQVTNLYEADPTTFLSNLETDLLTHTHNNPQDDLALLYLNPTQTPTPNRPPKSPHPNRSEL